MISDIALLQSHIDPQQAITTPVGLISAVGMLYIGLLPIFSISDRNSRYIAWLLWSSLALAGGMSFLYLSGHAVAWEVSYVKTAGIILTFGGMLAVIIPSINKLLPRASFGAHVLAFMLSVGLTFLLASCFRIGSPPVDPCHKISEGETALNDQRYQEAIALAKIALSAGNEQCVAAGHELLVRAYTRLSPPDCDRAFQHFAVLPEERKDEVSNEFRFCEQAH